MPVGRTIVAPQATQDVAGEKHGQKQASPLGLCTAGTSSVQDAAILVATVVERTPNAKPAAASGWSPAQMVLGYAAEEPVVATQAMSPCPAVRSRRSDCSSLRQSRDLSKLAAEGSAVDLRRSWAAPSLGTALGANTAGAMIVVAAAEDTVDIVEIGREEMRERGVVDVHKEGLG